MQQCTHARILLSWETHASFDVQSFYRVLLHKGVDLSHVTSAGFHVGEHTLQFPPLLIKAPAPPGLLMTGTIFLAWAACIFGYLIRTNDVRVHCFHITSLPHYHELSGVIQRAHNQQQKYHSRNPYKMASTSSRQGQRGQLYFVLYRNSTDFRAKHLPRKHGVPCRKQPKTETPTKPSTQFLGHFI